MRRPARIGSVCLCPCGFLLSPVGKGVSNDRENAFGEDRTDAASDLTEAMPLRRRKLKPVREPLEPRRLTRSDDASLGWMQRPDRLESAAIMSGPGSNGRAESVQIQPVRFGNGIALSRFDPRVSANHPLRAERAHAAGGQKSPFHGPGQSSNLPLQSAILDRFSLVTPLTHLQLSRSRCRQEE